MSPDQAREVIGQWHTDTIPYVRTVHQEGWLTKNFRISKWMFARKKWSHRRRDIPIPATRSEELKIKVPLSFVAERDFDKQGITEKIQP
jgi:hypothetical protein